jgi:hypothetical protein
MKAWPSVGKLVALGDGGCDRSVCFALSLTLAMRQDKHPARAKPEVPGRPAHKKLAAGDDKIRNRTGDIELLASWREWLCALDAEMSADDEREAERRHVRVVAIQNAIVETPSEGVVGIGLKLALASFLDGFDGGIDGDPAVSAYLDTLRMLDRDFLAEAEAVIQRSRDNNRAQQGERVLRRVRQPRRAVKPLR